MNTRAAAIAVILYYDWIMLFYFIAVNSFYTFLFALSIFELIKNHMISRNEHLSKIFTSESAPAISILAPAFNEEETIAESLHSMLTLEYPELEVIVINDGSSDGTLETLVREFDLFQAPSARQFAMKTSPVRDIYLSRKFAKLTVIDKENGGKADALNAGLNVARSPLVCAIDADTLIAPDALLKMARSFIFKNNVVAVGGTVRIANGCRIENSRVVEVHPPRKFLPSAQVVEYLRAYLFGRLGLNRLGGNIVISGAFGLFHRESVIEAGGYATDTVGEDIELVLRLHRFMRENNRPYCIDFIPSPVAWTEAPETLGMLSRQRDRWQRGLMDSLIRHRKMLLNPRYGATGMIVFPFFFFVELLAPAIELVGYIGVAVGLYFNIINWVFALLFFVAAFGFGMALSFFGLVLEEAFFQKFPKLRHVLYLALIAVFENLGYRQLTVFWRAKGMVKYLLGVKTWGKMERRGFHKG
jgi:cellulose synthase/poly-beta-1,6-N-acetylglucosamine synthase-like glycosyltransferase